MLWEEKILPDGVRRAIQDWATPEDEVLREIRETTERLFGERARMVTGHPQGVLLTLLSRLKQPRYALEIGTFTAYGTVCLARGLHPEGRLLTIEKDETLKEMIDRHLNRAGVADRVLVLYGDAKDLISDLPYRLDLVYLDAAKEDYPHFLTLLEPKLNPGALLIADNTLWGGSVLAPDSPAAQAIVEFNNYLARSSQWQTILLPIRDGVTLAQFLGS